MSKNSSKQREAQLVEWLAQRGRPSTGAGRLPVKGAVSRMEYSKQKGRI